MDIMIWLFLGFIVIMFSLVVLIKGISKRNEEPSEVNREADKEIHNRVTDLEKRVKKLEDEKNK